MISFYSKRDVRAKKLPIDHNIILCLLSRKPSWKRTGSLRYGAQVWGNGRGDEIILPTDNSLGDYYRLCFEAGITLGIIESVWAYKYGPIPKPEGE